MSFPLKKKKDYITNLQFKNKKDKRLYCLIGCGTFCKPVTCLVIWAINKANSALLGKWLTINRVIHGCLG